MAEPLIVATAAVGRNEMHAVGGRASSAVGVSSISWLNLDFKAASLRSRSVGWSMRCSRYLFSSGFSISHATVLAVQAARRSKNGTGGSFVSERAVGWATLDLLRKRKDGESHRA